jgi:hypothetical protein
VALFGSLPKPKQKAVAMATTTHQQKMMANEKNQTQQTLDARLLHLSKSR